MNTRKTAIVSCYFQPNYGSMLQALATQMALDRLGYDNETICIDGLKKEIRLAKMRYFAGASLTSDILLSKAGMAMARVRRKLLKGTYTRMMQERLQAFSDFEHKCFRMSEAYGSRAELTQACADKYSAVLVGSDQLWLPANIAADYYTLSFVPESINTISYATSFGQAQLPRSSERAAMRFLPGIKHISVREKTGQKIVSRLTGRRVPIVADPTLLFDGEEWKSVQQEEPLIKGDYIFCYFLGNNPKHRDFAVRLADETRCKIAAIPHVDEYVSSDETYADETPWSVGPDAFLNLIRHAQWVLTDSYHCTAFSMQYEKKFFTFRRYHRKTRQSTNSRLDTLLEQCGVSERLLTGEEEISACRDIMIDYEDVRSRISRLRKYSWNFLKDALEDKEETDLNKFYSPSRDTHDFSHGDAQTRLDGES